MYQEDFLVYRGRIKVYMNVQSYLLGLPYMPMSSYHMSIFKIQEHISCTLLSIHRNQIRHLNIHYISSCFHHICMFILLEGHIGHMQLYGL